MPLKLHAPGSRKGNTFWIARGRLAGKLYEISTGTRDKAVAAEHARRFELRVLDSRLPQAGETVSFGRAAELYVAYRDPARADRYRIDRLVALIGDRAVAEIGHADLVDAANKLQPTAVAATKNRDVLRPAAAILHYAADNKWCDWLRVKLFKESRPATRAVSIDTAALLIANAEGDLKRLLIWLFRQGTRITDTLALRWADIDLAGRTARLKIGKTDSWLTMPLHDDVFEALANAPGDRRGHVFPWRTRGGVYKRLWPLCRRLGVQVTPHMARHSVGKWINDAGGGLRTIMAALGQTDPKSAIRYTAEDVEVVRQIGRRVGNLVGKAKDS